MCIAPACKEPAEVGACFCKKHLASPSGQRGGWLSAHRRKFAMVTNAEQALDASNISPRLWMGSQPPFDRDLPKVDVLVLCAKELQPMTLAFHGLTLRCPMIDDYLDIHDIARALMVAHRVATLLVANQRVLVTCSQGRNRSGLICGFALGHLTRMSADQIIELIRKRRTVSGVLSNPAFVGYLQKYVGDRRAPKRA